MKQVSIEKIASALEDAAGLIEERDNEISALKTDIEKLAAEKETLEKTASYGSDNFYHDEMGEASDSFMDAPVTGADMLDSFLAG